MTTGHIFFYFFQKNEEADESRHSGNWFIPSRAVDVLWGHVGSVPGGYQNKWLVVSLPTTQRG